MTLAIKTWANTNTEENAMNDDHLDLWLRMIRLSPEKNLEEKTILDFGCNQGGFLKELYKQKPFKKAVGIDIAEESIALANLNLNGEPVDFAHSSVLKNYNNSFDIAYSHEVLYLLPNLQDHAKEIKSCLKDDGVYYAVIGCHTDNPLWKDWYKIISSYSNVPVKNYSLDDYAQAFFKEGFCVSALPFSMDNFIQLKPRNEYFPTVMDSLDYYTRNKIFFRFQKK